MGLCMSCAIKIVNSSNCSFINIGISGFDVGIDAENSDCLTLSRVDFGNCTTGMKGKNLRDLKAQDCAHGLVHSSSSLALSTGDNSSFYYTLLYLRAFDYNPYQ